MSKGGGKKNQQKNQKKNQKNNPIPENNNRNNNRNNNNNNKQQERQTRRQFKREKNRKKYGDAEWKREFDQFLDQLKLIGLTIKDVAGDGNCLFRAIADQMEGNPNKHPTYRKRICDFIEANREDYEPFLEDDELWDEYLPRMKTNGTWGGQMEIQACSLAFSVNITIHQLGQPRWDIVNFYGGMKTIHLSYHQGEHYSSVRKIGDVNYVPEPPKEIKIESKKYIKVEEDKRQQITPEELLVMETTGCQNREFISAALKENWSDVAATVEFILAVGFDNIEFQSEFLAEKLQEKMNSKSPRYPSITSTTTTTTQMDPQNEEERSPSKEKGQKKKKKEVVELNEVDKENFVHPKLQKWNDSKLTNRERKEKNKQVKTTTSGTIEKPFIPPPDESVDVSSVVQDLGSMQI